VWSSAICDVSTLKVVCDGVASAQLLLSKRGTAHVPKSMGSIKRLLSAVCRLTGRENSKVRDVRFAEGGRGYSVKCHTGRLHY